MHQICFKFGMCTTKVIMYPRQKKKKKKKHLKENIIFDELNDVKFFISLTMFFAFYTYVHILLCILTYDVYVFIRWTYLRNIHANSFQLHFMKFSWSFFFDYAYMKLTTLYENVQPYRSVLNSVWNILLHKYLIKKACKSHFILKNTTS